MGDENKIESLTNYTRLGSSGLRVSPLCPGTMTFGEDWGWGNHAADSRAIFDRFLDAGGNFIDTADGYTATSLSTIMRKTSSTRFSVDGGMWL